MWKREDTVVKWFSSVTYTWVLQVELGIGRQGKLFYPPHRSTCSEDLVDVCHLCAACRPCLSQPRGFLPILNCCMHGMGLPPSRSPPCSHRKVPQSTSFPCRQLFPLLEVPSTAATVFCPGVGQLCDIRPCYESGCVPPGTLQALPFQGCFSPIWKQVSYILCQRLPPPTPARHSSSRPA